jgi:hypothetical protein
MNFSIVSLWRKISLIISSYIILSCSFSFTNHNIQNRRFNRFDHVLESDRGSNDYESNKLISTSNSALKDSLLKNTLLLASLFPIVTAASAASAASVDDNIFTQTADRKDVLEENIDPKAAAEFAADVEKNRPLNSDEFIQTFPTTSLGLGLTETYYKGFPVVTVSSIKYLLNSEEGTPAYRELNPLLKVGAVLIGVEGDILIGYL